VVVVLMTVALILVEALVIRPAARRAAPDRLLLVTVGMLQAAGGIALIGWGNIPYTLSPFTGKAPVHLAGASVSTQTFWVLGALLVSVAALYGLLYATPLGLTMRATAENPDAARLVGVNVDRMRLLAFAISGATAGLAGATVIPLTFIGFDTAIPFAVYGFIAAVLGGLGRASGAVAAGLLLGLLEAALGRVVSGTLAEVVAIGVLIAILLVRPAGLLGSAEVGR
jgi:branched-subunit amino acid ABC-type transport system permease component